MNKSREQISWTNLVNKSREQWTSNGEYLSRCNTTQSWIQCNHRCHTMQSSIPYNLGRPCFWRYGKRQEVSVVLNGFNSLISGPSFNINRLWFQHQQIMIPTSTDHDFDLNRSSTDHVPDVDLVLQRLPFQRLLPKFLWPNVLLPPKTSTPSLRLELGESFRLLAVVAVNKEIWFACVLSWYSRSAVNTSWYSPFIVKQFHRIINRSLLA
jgi:hypothetical protein